jgi:hypothetical protein
MRDFRDAKAMAQSLRSALDDRSITVTHSDALELIARSFGFDNWNILAAKIEETQPPAPQVAGEAPPTKTLHCSFCGKSQHEVAKLIAGPDTFICDECIALCASIVRETDIVGLLQRDRTEAPGDDSFPALASFLRGRSEAELAAAVADIPRWLDHVRWSLRETAKALGEPAAAASGDPSPPRRTRDPLAGKSRAEILDGKSDMERRLADGLKALEVATRIASERPPAG